MLRVNPKSQVISSSSHDDTRFSSNNSSWLCVSELLSRSDALCLGDSYETDDEDKVATFETGRSLGINRKGCL